MVLESFRQGLSKKYDMGPFLSDKKKWSLFDIIGLFNGDYHLTQPTIKWQPKFFGHHSMVWVCQMVIDWFWSLRKGACHMFLENP